MNGALVAGRMSQFLHEATRELVCWLGNCLQEVDQDWWTSLVLPSLSYQQHAHVERRGITTLEQLVVYP